jgi:serine/threonine protein kinase
VSSPWYRVYVPRAVHLNTILTMSHQNNSSNIPVQVPLPKSLAAYAAAGDNEGSTDSLKTATSGLISSIFSHNKLSNASDAKEKSIQQQRNKDLIEWSRNKQCFCVWKTQFILAERYQPIKAIGKGAYGVVCSALDRETNKKVAIKKITNAFENIIDAKRTLRELVLLRCLKHENVVGVERVEKSPVRHYMGSSNANGNGKTVNGNSVASYQNDVYIVYELMDTDLHQIIRSSQPLTEEHFQFFTYQILRGLKYVHSAKVLHRDLKPSNILLNASCDLKIADFGLARTQSEEENSFMTEYVVTRWYRAPELLLSCDTYDAKIDVWSVGCIVAEMFLRKPLLPGKDYLDQLKLIIKTLGSPVGDELDFITAPKARAYIEALPKSPKPDLRRVFGRCQASSEAVDLIEKMLRFDPRKRITVDEALQHPWLKALHDPATEPVYGDGTKAFRFDFKEEELVHESDVRQRVWDEMCQYE